MFERILSAMAGQPAADRTGEEDDGYPTLEGLVAARVAALSGPLFVSRDGLCRAGAALFPETLKSEYHEVRAVIEAHSNRAALAGREEGGANGLALQKGVPWDFTVRVRSASGLATYRLDRWD